MKIVNRFTYITAALLFVGALHGNAQEFKEGESIKTQLKNGTAPGLKFAPHTPKPASRTADKGETQESTISQIRKGTLKDVRFAPGTGTTRSTSTSARNSLRAASANNIPSDQKASEIKPVIVPQGRLPLQEGATQPDGSAALPDKGVTPTEKGTQRPMTVKINAVPQEATTPRPGTVQKPATVKANSTPAKQ